MKLTDRLQILAGMVQNTEGTIADVGTDHGLIPIYLAKRFPDRKIYAMDVRKEPLQKAKCNAADHKVSSKIEFILSDGLKACLEEPIQTVIIAGMGGVLMERILKEGKSCFTDKTELILSPHGNADLVRKAIHQVGAKIEYERYIRESGQIYVILYAVAGKDELYSESEYIFGKQEKTTDIAVLTELWQKEKQEAEAVWRHLQTLPDNPALSSKKQKLQEQIADLTRYLNCSMTEKGEADGSIFGAK